jgi:hypothetical protein
MLSETQIKSMLDEKNIEYQETKQMLIESKQDVNSYDVQSMKKYSERLISDIILLETILEINQ